DCTPGDCLDTLLFHTRYLKQKDYWTKKLLGQVETTDILTDTNQHRVEVEKRGQANIAFNDELSRRILNMCKHAQLALYIFLLSALEVIIHRYTNNKDIIILSPILGEKATKETLNSLVLIRHNVEGSMTFKEFVLNLRCPVREAYENQDYPYEKLTEFLFPSSTLSPPTHISCWLKNIHREADIEKIKTRLGFCFSSGEEKLDGYILYDRSFYRETDIQRLADHLLLLLTRVSENINAGTAHIDFLTEEEKKQLLEDFNNNKVEFSQDMTFPRRFEAQVEQTPDRIAVFSHGRHRRTRTNTDNNITYFQLNERSDKLASLLIEKGVLADDIIGIMMERSIEMAIGILATWKSGSAYLPIDPEDPKDRIDYMLKDSHAAILLTDIEKKTDNCQCSIVNRQLSINGCPRRGLAYVIYTSGSTGKPKGAMVEHIGMMNHIHAKIDDLQLNERSIAAQNASHTFDISVWQFFAVLAKGGKTIIYPNELVFDPGLFISRLIKDQVTILEVVPSYLSVMLEFLNDKPRHFNALAYVLVTGETIKPSLVSQWFAMYPAVKMVNAYGPTEASDDITHFIMDKTPDMERIPIGKPLRNLNIYILDEYLNLCPPGIKGEICVAGVGVGRGYLNNPELTAEKFYRSYWSYGTYILYRTGDLARWLPDGHPAGGGSGGVIDFLGRIDHQVKVRGYRIEMGEIEKHLSNHHGIKEAVVMMHEEAREDKYLCAYFVSDKAYEQSELQEYLARELPDYMIPSYFVKLDKMPLTGNGKINRKALPRPELKAGENYTAPRDPIEMRLAAIWSAVLGRDELHASQLQKSIGIDDNFFQLGGHSLKATILVSKIHKELNVKIPLVDIFRIPTIRDLAALIKEMNPNWYAPLELVEKKEYYPLSSAQKRLYIIQDLAPTSTAYNMASVLQPEEKIDRQKLEETFKKLISRHESLRTSFIQVDGEPVQKVHTNIKFAIDYYEAADKECTAADVLKTFIRPFDLAQVPLFRVGVLLIPQKRKAPSRELGRRPILQTGEDEYYLMMDIHHITADGVSFELLSKEFMALNSGAELPPLKFQYKDYAQWQNRQLESGALKKQEIYWLDRLKDCFPFLNLPTDYERAGVFNTGGSIHFEIPGELTAKIRKHTAETGSTLFIFLLAVFTILLARYANREDIVVACPVANRTHDDLNHIIGMFMNMLAMRNFPAPGKTFRQFLEEVRRNAIEAFENQDYPFEELVSRLAIPRDMYRNPLTDVIFGLRTQTTEPGQPIREKKQPQNRTFIPDWMVRYDIELEAVETPEKVLLHFDYRTRLFKKETMAKKCKHFLNIIRHVTDHQDVKISRIEMLDETDTSALKQLLPAEMNNNTVSQEMAAEFGF
ncbi:MAG: amino acid adenylation domain-containing protein, partial [Acidobacteria bacterium]|nr:amino acid adenylation domain-containing protein [Acidobacteriota bacterium]